MEFATRAREQTTQAIGESFSRLIHIYNSCMQLTLGKYGLYPGQPQILFALRALKRPTQNEVAALLGVGKASVGISLRRLESGGFLKRIRDRRDTRCIRLALTPKGEDYARWCEIDYNMFYTTMLEPFTSDERAQALTILQGMQQSLSRLKERLEN
jgi:DNA-binding MarR family transcriptional regulator